MEVIVSTVHSQNAPAFSWRAWLRQLAGLRSALLRRTARQLQVRETLTLGEKRQLLIVQCGDKRLLIGTAGNFVVKLAELPSAQNSERDSV